MGFNSILGTIFQTYAENKKTSHWRYEDLDNSVLFKDYDYLKPMYDDAQEPDHYRHIAGHINRFDATDCGRYEDLYNDCLDKLEGEE